MRFKIFYWARLIHRWLSLFVGLQILLWVFSGAFFALVPFDEIIKSKTIVEPKIELRLTADEQARLKPLHTLGFTKPMAKVEIVRAFDQIAYKIKSGEELQFFHALNGRPLEKAKTEAVKTLALLAYKGQGALVTAEFYKSPPLRFFGLIDELYGLENLWLVEFDDTFNTRLYLQPDDGEIIRVRNDAWVAFDVLWRLHIMDYTTGEDFNNKLLRFFALISLAFVISGCFLIPFSFKWIRPKK